METKTPGWSIRVFTILILTGVWSTLYGQPDFQAYLDDVGARESGVTGVPITNTTSTHFGKVAFLHHKDITPNTVGHVKFSVLDPATGQIDYFPSEHQNHWTGWGTHEQAADLIHTSDGGFAILANTDNADPANSPYGGEDILITRTDDVGSVIWSIRVGSSANEWGSAMIQRSDGQELVVVGYTDLNIGGTTAYNGINVILFGVDYATGNIIWTNMYSGEYDDYGIDLVEQTALTGSALNYIVVGHGGTYSGTPGPAVSNHDIFSMRLDSVGGIFDMASYGHPNLNMDKCLNISRGLNNLFWIGGTALASTGNQHAVIIMIDNGLSAQIYKDVQDPPWGLEGRVHLNQFLNTNMMVGNRIDPSGIGADIFFMPFDMSTSGPTIARTYGSDPIPVYEQSAGFTFLPPSFGMGYISWGYAYGSAGMNPNVWYVGVDINGSKTTCENIDTLIVTNLSPDTMAHFASILPSVKSTPVTDLVTDSSMVDTLECPILPPPPPNVDCFADTSGLYLQIDTDVVYTAYVVWPAKVNVHPGVTVTVTDGATLDITNTDVILGPDAQIVFLDSACIRANNSVFRPCEKDSTWLGIDLSQHSTGIVDECVFKNAEVALYIVKESQIKVTNNEFVNCNISVETIFAGNGGIYTEGITGNTVLLDGEHPVYTAPNFTGFRMNSTFFTGMISQNDFINGTKVNATTSQFTAMDYFFCAATSSENKITNAQYGIRMTGSAANGVGNSIENNEIEYTDQSYLSNAIAIELVDNFGTFVQGNEIVYTTTTNGSVPLMGIHIDHCGGFMVYDNEINGFQEGIRANQCNSGSIHRNTIDDCTIQGINIQDCINGLTISENVITLDADEVGTSVGIRYGQVGASLPPTTSFRSNCIFDTDWAMFFIKTGVGPQVQIPTIHNNAMYNYNTVGLLSINMGGPIGVGCFTEPQFGRNSFITNVEPGSFGPWDVVKLPGGFTLALRGNLTSADNNSGTTWYAPGSIWQWFGDVSPPPPSQNCRRGSRANCFHDVTNKTGSTVWDEYQKMLEENYPVEYGATFTLKKDFAKWITEKPAAARLQAGLDLIKIVADNKEELQKLESALDATELFRNDEAAIWKYEIKSALAEPAAEFLQTMEPQSDEMSELKFVLNLKEEMKATGSPASESQLEILRSIRESGGRQAKLACNFLFHPDIVQQLCVPEFAELPELPEMEMHMTPDYEEWLTVAPNPSKGTFEVSWGLSELENLEMTITNSMGQLILREMVDFGAGKKQLDLSDHPTGIYIVSIQGEDGLRQARKINIVR